LLYYEIGSIAKIENESVLQNVINGKKIGDLIIEIH
jgi:hypothetical protein